MPSNIRSVVFAALLGYSVAVPGARADELTGPPPPLPLAIGEHVAADLVNLIFLFDRVASHPPRAITPNYLARVSEPSSALNRDYLEYRQGKINRAELVDRLPHVAMLGDSLTQHFYFSSLASSFWRARTQWRKNWFLDDDPSPGSIFSIYERLERFTPLVVTQYNGAGALVAPPQSQGDLRKRLVRARNLPGQVRQALRRKRFPDLIMIWIGHNNLDWVYGVSEEGREHPEERLQAIATQFRISYAQSLQSLIDRAKTENHKVAIVVFGLANIDAYLKARRQAEILHAENPKLYPHFSSGTGHFESLKHPYQKDMARLSLMLNAEMRAMVADVNRELNNNGHVRVEYSDALTKIDFSRLEFINSVDGMASVDRRAQASGSSRVQRITSKSRISENRTTIKDKTRLQVSNYQARL